MWRMRVNIRLCGKKMEGCDYRKWWILLVNYVLAMEAGRNSNDIINIKLVSVSLLNNPSSSVMHNILSSSGTGECCTIASFYPTCPPLVAERTPLTLSVVSPLWFQVHTPTHVGSLVRFDCSRHRLTNVFLHNMTEYTGIRSPSAFPFPVSQFYKRKQTMQSIWQGSRLLAACRLLHLHIILYVYELAFHDISYKDSLQTENASLTFVHVSYAMHMHITLSSRWCKPNRVLVTIQRTNSLF